MVDFLDEVIEDVKQERFRRIFNKYGNHLVTAVLLLVFLAGASVWYKNYKKEQIITAGDLFSEAANLKSQGKVDLALANFDKIIKDGNAGYVNLAELVKAGELQQRGDFALAAELYAQIAASDASEEIRDFALLHKIFLSVEYPDKESLENADSSTELEEISKTGSPWRFSALELQGIMALKNNDNDKAKELFTILRDDALSPRSVKERASIMLESL
jgi:hypothetical protein